MATNEDERQRQRELLYKEDEERKERQSKGIIDSEFTPKEEQLIKQIVKLSSIAKMAARTKIAVKVFDDAGKPVTLEERVANEDMIFQSLLMTKLNQRMEDER